MVLTPAARLLVARVSLIVLASLPALIATHGDLATGPGTQPWFTDVRGRLPFFHMLRFFAGLPSLVPVLLVAVGLAILGNQLLTAGALSIFLGQDGAGVLRRARSHGARHIGPFLRILVLSAVASAIGASIVARAIDGLGHAGASRGWTSSTLYLVLPSLRMLGVAVVLATVGAWTLCARALTVADRRSRVRRTALLALRLCWRAKLRWLGPFVGATLATTVASGAIVVAWLQSEPRGWAVGGWIALWALVLVVQAAIWLWLVHGAARLVVDPLAADLRSRPDTALGARRLIKRWLPKKSES